ncbi:MAG: tetraacyldisaccharide 4'-kinase [Rhodocyclaceae bacterium]
MALSGIARALPRLWYRRAVAAALWPLLPVSWLFRLLVVLRRALYRRGVLRSQGLPVPVIVVGNLTVGGSGKTPLVLWLVERLREQGWRPGIISRGYGGSAQGALAVSGEATAAEVGDEPLLLARRSGAPVFVGRDRVAAGRALLTAHPDCNIVLSDDGLQHYRLQRSLEIAVFDGRGAGNGCLLPAGPLREPLSRLSGVTAVVWNGGASAGTCASALSAAQSVPQFEMLLHGRRFVGLADAGGRVCDADALRGRRLYAVAGIGDPARFFAQLAALGLEFEAHPFPDHHCYTAADLAFARDGTLLMTEKDAVKCAAITVGEAWVLPVEAEIGAAANPTADAGLLETILEKLDGRTLA